MAWLRFLALLAVSLNPLQASARHVVVLVWDGLRPDTINDADTPTLAAMARRGVFFANHHAVFLTSTIVNGTAMATGCYPSDNHTCANMEYRPSIAARQPVATAHPEVLRRLPVPPLAQLLQQAGLRTAVTGSKSVALVHDHQPTPPSMTISEGNGRPEQVFAPIRELVGPAPLGGTLRDDWCVRTMIGPIWDQGLPALSLVWLSEPDLSQHETGLGSDASRAALRNSDQNLARVLDELQARGVADQTDVLVVSDHGFSTVTGSMDVTGRLRAAGFRALEGFQADPQPGEVLVVNNGGAALLYVIGRDRALIGKLVAFLQHQPESGVILTRDRWEGTFDLAKARVATATPPDIILSMRWSPATNAAGMAGTVLTAGPSRGVGMGAHGSLSRYDLHNTLIAAGPGFQVGMTNSLPSGNADLAPTILALLGREVPASMKGRILHEAFRQPGLTTLPPLEVETLESTRTFPDGVWQQYLRIIRFGSAVYLDEGNGAHRARR